MAPRLALVAVALVAGLSERAASRQTSSAPLATPSCSANAANAIPAANGAGELVTVEAPDLAARTGTAILWRRSGSCFVAAAGPFQAVLGANGLSAHHHEGDDTTPVGVFGFGPTMYGALPDPQTAYPYHRLVCGDWWDEDPASPDYNRFVHVACGTAPPFGGGSEALWTELPAYDAFAVVAYNSDPVVKGAGSGIFVHVQTGHPTAGCVALALPALISTLRFLNPRSHPLIAIGPPALLFAIRHVES